MKAIENKKELKKASALLNRQIFALLGVIEARGLGGDLQVIVDEKDSILQYINKNKCWNFNFKHGGWNSVHATNKETAYKLAVATYNKKGNEYTYGVIESDGTTGNRTGWNDDTIVLEDSMRLANAEDTSNLLSLFY